MGPEQSSSRPQAGNDNGAEGDNRSLLADMVMGLRFYSCLPSGGLPHEPPVLSRIAPALGFTSLVIGAGPALLLVAAAGAGAPPLLAAALALAASAAVTGAMSEDALADSFDGLFGGHSIERRLDILKDSRHGTFGVTALVLLLIARAAALAALVDASVLTAGALWLAAMVLARSGSLWLTLALPPARREGASSTAGRVAAMPFYAGAGIAILLGFILAAPFAGALGLLAGLVVCGAVAFAWMKLCQHKLGGQTGDMIGALQALLEIAALSTFIVFAGL